VGLVSGTGEEANETKAARHGQEINWRVSEKLPDITAGLSLIRAGKMYCYYGKSLTARASAVRQRVISSVLTTATQLVVYAASFAILAIRQLDFLARRAIDLLWHQNT
jgi:hypothetical protein